MAVNLTAGDAFSVSGLIGLIDCPSLIFIYLYLGEETFIAWTLLDSCMWWQKTASGLDLAGLQQPKINQGVFIMPGGGWGGI